MSEQFKDDDPISQEPGEQDVAALVKKMQHQLAALERKIDVLIEQSAHRPSGERNFSKPFRSFDRPRRPFDRPRGDSFAEKRFDRGGRRFEKRGSEEAPRFEHKKKDFGEPRERDFGGEARSFPRRSEGSRGGFEHKKKPFPFKRKGRR